MPTALVREIVLARARQDRRPQEAMMVLTDAADGSFAAGDRGGAIPAGQRFARRG
jgi:hypothetical protein